MSVVEIADEADMIAAGYALKCVTVLIVAFSQYTWIL